MRSSWNDPTIAASSCACPDSSADADEDSSEFAAFCCVTLSICPTALFTWSIPSDCSLADALISETMSETFVIPLTISASFSLT